MSSIAVGVEVAFGPEISLGLFLGVARHEVPESGYEPGRMIPATINSVPTEMSLTGMTSLVLNFTPGVSKSLGVK